MLQQLDKCPLCNSGHFTHYLTCKDFTVSNENFSLVTCDNCDFLFTNPRPVEADLPKYYQSEDYISHTNKSTNLTNIVYKMARKFTINNKVKLINKLSQKGKILDIGCGTGYFLKACQNNGWYVHGVEPDEQARSIAKENTGIQLNENITDIKETNYDVITLWHVLEHLPDLDTFMTTVGNILSKTGTLIVAVPNYKSYDADYYKNFWAAYDVPRHLYHFDQKTMQRLCEKYGLNVTQVLPMKLDAYYVSLLSESYKQPGPMKYLRSIVRGCKSNNYAKNHYNNYSSLTYIITSK